MTIPENTTNNPTITTPPLLQQQQQTQTHTNTNTKQQHNGQIVRIIPFPYTINPKLATIAKDGRIHIWSSSNLSLLQSLDFSVEPNQHNDNAPWPTDAIVADIQGQKRLIVSAADRSISVFNVLRAEEDPDRPDENRCLGYSGKYIASASFGVVSALGTTTSQNTASSNNNSRLLVGTMKGSVEVLQSPFPSASKTNNNKPTNTTDSNEFMLLDKTKTIRLHKEHTDSITQILNIPNTGILSSSLDSTIKLFDPTRNCLKFSWHLHNSAVRCMAYDPTLSLCCSGGAERSVMIWHPHGDPNRAIGKLSGHVHGTVSIALGHQIEHMIHHHQNTTMTTMATQHSDSSSLSSTEASSTVSPLLPSPSLSPSSSSSHNHHHVFTLSGHGTLTAWDLRTFRPLQTIGKASWMKYDENHPVVMCFDQENQCLITGTRRPAIWKYNNNNSG